MYLRVCLEGLGYTLPAEVVTSAEIERRLGPLYSRLRLPEGRLELMTGIAERRFWPAGTLPSTASVASAQRAIDAAGIDRSQIGAMIHASVCRDHLEPATAAVVHRALELPPECVAYDCSNACLGFLNGLLQVANMIELGQIHAGMVVSSEGSRELVETTIDYLNRSKDLSRDALKPSLASLTIGSASVAAVLTDSEISRTDCRLLGGIARAETAHVDLCKSGRDEGAHGGMAPLMRTDAEALMAAGIAAAERAFAQFLESMGWTPQDIDHSICHQVGLTHRRLMLDQLGLSEDRDFYTVDWLGNTGSAALPITLATAAERGQLTAGERVAMLGIGSGINVVMLGAQWQPVAVRGGVGLDDATPAEFAEGDNALTLPGSRSAGERSVVEHGSHGDGPREPAIHAPLRRRTTHSE